MCCVRVQLHFGKPAHGNVYMSASTCDSSAFTPDINIAIRKSLSSLAAFEITRAVYDSPGECVRAFVRSALVNIPGNDPPIRNTWLSLAAVESMRAVSDSPEVTSSAYSGKYFVPYGELKHSCDHSAEHHQRSTFQIRHAGSIRVASSSP